MWLAAVNLPFLLCHPELTAIENSFVRSLAINAVLFLAPGLPCMAIVRHRGWAPRFELIWVMGFSLVVFLASIAGIHLLGRDISPGGVWNFTWIVTNLIAAVGLVRGVSLGWDFQAGKQGWGIGLPLFVLCYSLYFWGAVRVIPAYDDADFELQGTGAGLLESFEPLMMTDRKTLYYFAHPPLLHFYVAGSFLYFDKVEHLKYFADATERVRAVEAGESLAEGFDFETVINGRPMQLSVVGSEGANYRIVSPLTGGQMLAPARGLELDLLYQHFRSRPHLLETRAPNIFLAALTVALLGVWCFRLSGSLVTALAIGVAFATSPEVFVRSSYLYGAINNFTMLLVLIFAAAWEWRREWFPAVGCALAAAFAALANHKLLTLPAAFGLWELIKSGQYGIGARISRAVFHPAVIGFGIGTVIFWAYGLIIDAEEFWADHFRNHILDRIVHDNRLGYGGYPTAPGLWLELWRHTGYLLIPFGGFALFAGLRSGKEIDGGEVDGRCPGREVAQEKPERSGGTEQSLADAGGRQRPPLQMTTLPWVIWAVATALAYTVIDWRMTKHLMPLLLPLHLAPALWAARGAMNRYAVQAVFVALVAWNLYTIGSMARDFASFSISPSW